MDNFDFIPSNAKLRPFIFHYDSWEVWQNQQLISSKNEDGTIHLNTKAFDDGGFGILTSRINSSSSIDQFLNTKCFFDILKYNTQRFMLCFIPENENMNECIGLSVLRGTLLNRSPTRVLTETDSYACSIFLKEGYVARMAFSTNKPERLIEFNAINYKRNLINIG